MALMPTLTVEVAGDAPAEAVVDAVPPVDHDAIATIEAQLAADGQAAAAERDAAAHDAAPPADAATAPPAQHATDAWIDHLHSDAAEPPPVAAVDEAGG